MATVARDLLVARLQSWAQATLVSAWTQGALPAPTAPISLPATLLNRIAGEPLPLNEAAELLERLGCTVHRDAAALRVQAPSWRHDLTLAEDLAEEVLRLRGYECIPSVLPPLEGPPLPIAADYLHRQSLAQRLAHLGFHQTVTYGFVSPEMDAEFPDGPRPSGASVADDPAHRALSNPLGRDYSLLRRSLVPSLVEVAKRNLQQGQREVRLFEIAPVYWGLPNGPLEKWAVALLWAGERWDGDPESKAGLAKEKHLSGILKDLMNPMDYGISVHPIQDGMLVAEYFLKHFRAPDHRIIPTYTPHSRFPAVERDLSLVVPVALEWKAMQDVVKAALAVPELQGLTCADLYQGKGLEPGTKAWLLRLTFQAMDRTLTGEEVEGWTALALEAAKSLGAHLRA
jgi:phenylalanyl-tRNA synthetase beta chain